MPQKEYQLNVRIDQNDLENIDYLKQNGIKIPALIRNYIARYVRDKKAGLDGSIDEVRMDSVVIKRNVIVVYGSTLPADRERIMDLMDQKRLPFLPGRKGFLIRLGAMTYT